MRGFSNLTAWERWELASFDDSRPPAPPPAAEPSPPPPPPDPPSVEVDVNTVHLPTAEELEAIHQQARDEGYAKGREEGYQAGLDEGRQKTQDEADRLGNAAGQLEDALHRIEGEVAEEVLALAIELAREVIRQEISTHPKSLLAVVREALTHLPHQHVAIYLHPEDASLLRTAQGDQLSHAGHRIHEDVKLSRGDCLLEAGGSQVDATVAMRWRRVLEGLGMTAPWKTDPLPPIPSQPAESPSSTAESLSSTPETPDPEPDA